MGCSLGGLLNVPLLGSYSESFDPLVPSILLSFPASPSVLAALPLSLLHTTNFASFRDHDRMMILLCVYPLPLPSPCQHFLCTSNKELNLFHHAWAFAPLFSPAAPNSSLPVLTGLFGPRAVLPTHRDLPPASAGIPFGMLASLPVMLHGFPLSPCNAQFRLMDEEEENDQKQEQKRKGLPQVQALLLFLLLLAVLVLCHRQRHHRPLSLPFMTNTNFMLFGQFPLSQILMSFLQLLFLLLLVTSVLPSCFMHLPLILCRRVASFDSLSCRDSAAVM